MASIKFEYPAGSPTTTLELTWGDTTAPPLWNANVGSVDDEAFDGTTYAYNKGDAHTIIPVKLDLLTNSEKDGLIDFFLNVVEGSYRVFRYTDHDGVTHDVRFLDELLNFSDGDIPYSVEFELLEV